MNCGQNPVCLLPTSQTARPTTTHMKLWRIKWQMTETWLSEYGRKDEMYVTNFPKMWSNCSGRKVAITYVGNQNFSINGRNTWTWWRFLLELIRAERDDNWTLCLEVFSVMLTRLTIYNHTSYANGIYVSCRHETL